MNSFTRFTFIQPKISTLVVLLGALFQFYWGCAATTSSASHAASLPNQTVVDPVLDATIAPGDSFEVRVYGEKDLSGEFRVSSDGTFDYPLLGNIQISGLTPSEVSALLERRFIDGEFLKSPQVSILVKKFSSKKISVFGQVNKPGTFPWQEGMGVVEAISLAGGFAPMAKTDNTMVTRQANGKKQNFVVPVEEIGQGKTSDFNLRPGDIIFVPERVF